MNNLLGINESFSSNFDFLYGKLPVGIIVFDDLFNITYTNDILRRFSVINEIESVKNINLLNNELFEGVDLSKDLVEIKDGKFVEKEIKRIKRLLGGEISILLKGAPLILDNEFIGGVFIIEDVAIAQDIKSHDKFFDFAFIENELSKVYSAFIVTDLEKRIKYKLGSDVTFFKVSKLLKKKDIYLNEYLNEQVLQKIDFSISTVIKTKKELISRVEIVLHENKELFELSIKPYINYLGEFKYVFIYLTNKTDELIQIEKYKGIISELKLYQKIFEVGKEFSIILNKEFKILLLNSYSELVLGYTKTDIFLKDLFELLFIDSQITIEKIKREISALNINSTDLPHGKLSANVTYKFIFKTKKGLKRLGEFSFAPVSSENGLNILVIGRDITDAEKIHEELRNSHELYKKIYTNLYQMVLGFNADGKVVLVNPYLCNYLGYVEKDILNKHIKNFVSLDDNSTELIQYLLDNNINAQARLKTKAKEQKDCLINLNSFITDSTNGTGTNKLYLLSITDISEKVLIEKELATFKEIFNSSEEGIAMLNNGVIVLANEKFADMHGYLNAKEISGIRITELVNEADSSGFTLLMESKNNLPARFEYIATKKHAFPDAIGGGVFSVEAKISSIKADSMNQLIIIRDITEKKRQQLALQESEDRYRGITENLDDFFYSLDLAKDQYKFLFFTIGIEKITGYTQEEMLLNSRLFFRIVLPEDFKLLKIKIRTFFDNIYKDKDEWEYRIITKDGNIIWIKNKVKARRDSNGKAVQVFGVISDISLRKKAEEEIRKSTEGLKNLNDTKDRFISIISHDLRTPFSSVLGFTDILLGDDTLSKSEIKQYVKYIQEASNNMLTLVNSLLDWTRLQTGRIQFKPNKVDLFTIVENTINGLAGVAINKSIKLINEINPELFVFIDRDLILQVFNNLVSNALKFTPVAGNITIRARQSEELRFVEVSVEDTGVGISKDNINKLFNIESKLTTEGTQGEKGTGLGLSLVKEIVEKHGGKVWVESEIRLGSKFKFILPKASSTILLIDDNNTDLILYSKIVKSIVPDYEVITAKNGQDGLRIVEEISPALIITDHVLAGMSGYEFVKELFKDDFLTKPPIIILSDRLNRGEKVAFEDLGLEFAFQKPVNLNSFKEAIEKSLKKLIPSVVKR